MTLLDNAEAIRIETDKILDNSRRSKLGQFFTPAPIAMYMASLFHYFPTKINLLDPGCGAGTLTAAFVNEAITRKTTKDILINGSDIEENVLLHAQKTFDLCIDEGKKAGVKIEKQMFKEDYLLMNIEKICCPLLSSIKNYTHIIMNPPYKKILTNGDHRKALSSIGIETVNLYSGFIALAIKELKRGGELVAIIPRSFCNGPYYKPFREFLFSEVSIKHIHIFDSRNMAFRGNDVLQENIIIHVIKGAEQKEVTITSSPTADFHIDAETQSITATDMTIRKVAFEKIVYPNDTQKFIHIAANNRDQIIIDQLSCLSSSIKDLGVQISTGPVVDFRLKSDLRQNYEEGLAPLIYPTHLNGELAWPKEGKKPNAIAITNKSKPWLWKSGGNFLLIRRLSSKEEKRRIVAAFFDSSVPGEYIGFDNKLNVFHSNKSGIDSLLAKGLYVYLNSTILDKYYRLFGGHTQVNATDLKNLQYPDIECLKRIGLQVTSLPLSQDEIDSLLAQELSDMSNSPTSTTDSLQLDKKLSDAIKILKDLGLPKEQQNERSALTLLALIGLKPSGEWNTLSSELIGVTPIMDWCKEHYGKEYKPNTRETFRRQTLHQFMEGGIVAYNPDDPTRPVNSPKACYQILPEVKKLLECYNTADWDNCLKEFMKEVKTLVAKYAKARELEEIPLTLPNGKEIRLSPGEHSQLIHDIVKSFGPKFAPEAEVIYLGDTEAKQDYFAKDRLEELGVTVNEKGKLPDVVLYLKAKKWLFLIESVTSHGPVDGKRYIELEKLFKDSIADIVYVSAFPDKATMKRFIGDVSWETEIWISEEPDHMIHLNGHKFLGPYTKD